MRTRKSHHRRLIGLISLAFLIGLVAVPMSATGTAVAKSAKVACKKRAAKPARACKAKPAAPPATPQPTPTPAGGSGTVVTPPTQDDQQTTNDLQSEPEVTDTEGFGGEPYIPCQCTRYAWEHRPDLPGNLGNANTWNERAAAQGFPVDGNPQVGDIAVFEAWSKGARQFGHVAYVSAVHGDGTITISEDNWAGPCHPDQRRITAAGLSFIHHKGGGTTPPPPPPIYRDIAVPGDWDGNGTATVGVFRHAQNSLSAYWLLRNSNSPGNADVSLLYGNWADDATTPGDWDGNGTTTVGVARRDGNEKRWALRNSNTPGSPDIAFDYGNYQDVPIVGDWNGDGIDTVGVYRPAPAGGQEGTFLLRNSNTAGPPDITIDYGGFGDQPAVGDWNGDGVDTIGVYRPAGSPGQEATWLLRNSNTPGQPEITFRYGGYGEIPLEGDWDGNGTDTIGIWRPAQQPGLGLGWLLRNSLASGKPDYEFSYGGASY